MIQSKSWTPEQFSQGKKPVDKCYNNFIHFLSGGFIKI
jgi:hypothetical protein